MISHSIQKVTLMTLFGVGMKALAWFIGLNDMENKNMLEYPCPNGLKNCEILIINTCMT